MDMMDGYRSSTFPDFYGSCGFGGTTDQVEGYLLVEIQDAIINNPTTWNERKANINNNYNHATENHLDALFDAWLNY